ncbi:hypothetical protein D3870_03980 [Noviherbaspirillum cavernae]|uniref:PKD/Chitinase domain-containing protein n=1 Tax=Noviherbaspirillum cavernae TaxID=2320862 RepID=A0A418WYI4_9BURK|nr:Ig-like domain-containing protein [Noviherbaspirillum cavernae]RJG05287.1 hypothetical protein D3870_03980 [Noviherbaspirillum cavernae]
MLKHVTLFLAALFTSWGLHAQTVSTIDARTLAAIVGYLLDADPRVALTASVSNFSYSPLSTVTLTASDSEFERPIAKVEFFNGTTLIGTATAAPYTYSWNNVPAGSYTITAKATDSQGVSVKSNTVPLVVKAPPEIEIIVPENNRTYFFVAPEKALKLDLSAVVKDCDRSIVKVEFFNGATLLGGDTRIPFLNCRADEWGIAFVSEFFTWTNIAPGNYTITVKATDTSGTVTTSAPVNMTVMESHAPAVNITVPANNASYTAPVEVTLTANATDSDGSIVKVEFFHGTALIGTSMVAPYTFNWTHVAGGNYAITAKATDDKGLMTTSAAVTFTVAHNQAPTVALTAPANNANYMAPATVTLTATASDTDGSIAKVEFFNGSTLLGTATAAPYTFDWTSVAAGSYTITAKATDDKGLTTTSAAVAITVAQNQAPTVALTAPDNGASYISPASIALTANATDVDGTIAKVELYDGSTLLATLTQAPYTFMWNDATAGSHALLARATDNFGTTVASPAVTITVISNQAPAVSVTATPDIAAAPATIELAATATDTDGTIARVEFFNGSTLLATVTNAPYVHSWTGVAQGGYTITAKAVDNAGAVTASAPVAVTVTGNGEQAAYYIYADHLNTPRLITDAGSNTVWKWDNDEPFGNGLPDANPGGAGTNFEFNLRFPGQYFDRETNLHYNYHRDYDPGTGRYVQSDPIGLQGGINTYAYVGGNPINRIDPMGLETVIVINNNTPLIGMHAGVYTGSGSDRTLYDPGGSYRNYLKGSGDALYGRDANLRDYIKYQTADGSDVQVYRFPTTPEEERQISSRIEEQGGGTPGNCAIRTSQAIQGIGPFKNLGVSLTPAGLGRDLAKISGSK